MNLDNAADRQAAALDPDGFVAQFPDGLLAIDEVQRVPELMTALKANVDRDRYARRDYLELAIAPAFPGMQNATGRTRARRLGNYVDRVLSKDTTDITGIAHPDRLEPLLRLIAARDTGEFVTARVGREIDIPERSLPTYLAALRSVYLVRVVRGWSNNVASRAVSTPKVSLADTGLAAYLAGIDADGLEQGVSATLAGGFVEGFVLGELAKQRAWSAKHFTLSHFRDNHGREVDIVLEDRRREVVGVEVKATSNPRGDDFRGLGFLRDKLGDRFRAGVLLHTGTRSIPFGDRLWALPIATLWDH